MMMTKKHILIFFLYSISFISCEITDFDLQENPNQLTPNSVDADFVLNEIQILFVESMNALAINTDDVMRYEAMRDAYTDIADNSSLNGEWLDVYRLRENTKIIESLAESDDNLLFHRGIARLLQAYSTITLVDYLGDIPFSEANDANNFNPVADDDEAIYTSILAEIDLAIADFNNQTVAPDLDLYYNGDAEKWTRAANSLKFRMYLNTGNTSAINGLLSADNLISTETDDFQFQFTNVQVPADSRHPYFQRGYDPTDGQGEYMGNFFMSLLKDSKSVRDPRLRYYFYRQTGSEPGSLIDCTANPIFDFCYIGEFYIGRDHGDDSASPNDRFLKTIYGIYPGGGAFDGDNPIQGSDSSSLGGAGIFPVLLSSYMNFLRAEAVLSLGANGNALESLEAGIRESMNKVIAFGELSEVMDDVAIEDDPSTIMINEEMTIRDLFAATQTDVDMYVDEVLAEYIATDATGKLDIVMREYYIAAFGNSIEAYNGYRRTGFPSNLQIPIINETNPFPRTFSYPEDAVDRNTSLTQRPITNQVFWDVLPAGSLK